MAIRTKNLDLNTDGQKRYTTVALGDITADFVGLFFTAPTDCVVNAIDIFSNEANPPAGTTASTTNVSMTIHAVVNGSANVVAIRSTSATAINSDSISANVRYRIIPSANNSLTVGSPLRLTTDIGGSGNLSATIVGVLYTPLVHRSTR
jgi:hypothetical protein